MSSFEESFSAVVTTLHAVTSLVVPLAREDADVRTAERRVAERVQHRVYGGVYVAEIVAKVPQ